MQQRKKKGLAFGAFFKRACLMLSVVSLLLAMPVIGLAAESDAEAMSDRNQASEYEGLKLCPGGVAFGVKFFTKGVLVVGISEIKSGGKEGKPAADAGIRVKDIILSVDGTEVNRVQEISERIEASEGKGLKITLMRAGKTHEVTLTPEKSDSDGKYRAGMWLRDSTAGIGTVTYVDPETGAFGGLGHGICDIDTGELMPLMRGSAMKVEIGGVVKGKAGKPGELKGYFLPERSGNVISNTVCGVFGIFTALPEGLQEAVSVGLRDEVKEGKAEVLCTLGDDGVQRYEIEISKINRNGTDNKNFVVTVTDAKLIERTGGIVQGMSGSPILQNGKLIGAITHVLVNDPTTGYGIFIENMLDAAS